MPGCLFAVAIATLAVAQAPRPQLPKREFKTPEQWQRERPKTRFSVAYVPLGWKRRSESDRRFAEAQATRLASEGARIQERSVLLSRPPEKMSRREILGALVAIQVGVYTNRDHENAVFARADAWRRDYSLTEYKWRTLAHWNIQNDLPLLAAYQKLTATLPDDWRVETVYIDALLSDKPRQDTAVLRARALARKYPKWFGAQAYLARVLGIRAWQSKNPGMYREALRIIDAARPLIRTEAERKYYDEERASILQNQKG